jgi:hypothetical protein
VDWRCGEAAGAPPRLRAVDRRWVGSEGWLVSEEDEEVTGESDSMAVVRPDGHVAAVRWGRTLARLRDKSHLRTTLTLTVPSHPLCHIFPHPYAATSGHHDGIFFFYLVHLTLKLEHV